MANETATELLKEKINQLNEKAWLVRVSDSTNAHQLSKEAIDLAESINYDKGKPKAIVLMHLPSSVYPGILSRRNTLKKHCRFLNCSMMLMADFSEWILWYY